MINRVVLVGRLTKDPEVRKTTSGTSVCSFTLAVSRRKSNDPNAPTADFISCTAWNQTADLMGQYLHKGSQIGVEGRLQTRNYDDSKYPGRKVYVTEVICENLTFLDSKSQSNNQTTGYDNSYNSGYYPDANPYDESSPEEELGSPTLNISSDDLPF